MFLYSIDLQTRTLGQSRLLSVFINKVLLEYRNIIYLHIVYGCSYFEMVDWSICNRLHGSQILKYYSGPLQKECVNVWFISTSREA